MNFFLFLSSSIGKKTVMAITGFCLGLFLLGHLIGNSFSFFGRDAFLAYAAHLHSLGMALSVIEFFLYLVFFLHILFAAFLYIQNLAARPVRYAVNNAAGGSTFASKTMPYTGLIILIFLVIHLKTFHFTSSTAPIADIVRYTLQQPLMALFYIVGLLALIIHTSHGFWSLFQSMGINHPNYDALLRRGALLISLTGGTIYILIPLLALTSANFLL